MKKVVVLTGAGMSAESGLSTFRDSGGLWEQYEIEDVATPEGYAKNPKLVVDFYNKRRVQLLSAKPCRGHELLADLEAFFEIQIITQNVDNLHERAGSSSVLHLHGELMKVTSSKDPENDKYIKELKPEQCLQDWREKAADGSLLRPYIVWFGESVPLIENAIELTRKADVFIVIGTSLNVYPAAGLLNYVADDVPVFLIDPQEVNFNFDKKVHHIKMGASQGIEKLQQLLKK